LDQNNRLYNTLRGPDFPGDRLGLSDWPTPSLPLRCSGPMPAEITLILGIVPSPAVHEALALHLQELTTASKELVASERLLLTVLHVGRRSTKDLDSIIETFQRAAAGTAPFSVNLHSIETMPRAGPIRSIAAMLSPSTALLHLRARMAARLTVRRERSDDFEPHITLARFKVPQPGFRLKRSMPPVVWQAEQMFLFQSSQGQYGSNHQVLAEVTFRV